ncbi:AmmeMemoRadiSam system protein A, partial [bacterium]|nr:AmmeMemoRadiSam system protein A [bacterium]
VSYAAIVFRYRQDYLNAKEQAVLLHAARKTLADTLQEESIKEYQCKAREITERLKGKKGVFVTLHKKSRLRGCIGQFEGSEPLHRMIPKTALLSAFRDTRFQPLQKDELEDIDIEISILSPMKSVESWQDIVLGRDGIRIEKAGKSALYLPQVALEQGWGVEETLAHLCEKAGLKSDDWKKNCHLKTFSAQVFGETFRKLQKD